MKNHEILPFSPILAFLWVNPSIVNAKTKMAQNGTFLPIFWLFFGVPVTRPVHPSNIQSRRSEHPSNRKKKIEKESRKIVADNDESWGR